MTNNNEKKLETNLHVGGAKRKNGHKIDCSCHICENIKNKAKRGGYEEDIKKHRLKKLGGSKKKNGHKPECNCPICKNMKNMVNNKKKKGGNLISNTDSDSDSDSDSTSSSSSEENLFKGGIKKKKRGNGHKITCKCPICKNIRNKKGGDESNLNNLFGKEDEENIKNNLLSNETQANDEEYNKLDLEERGILKTSGGGIKNKRYTMKNRKYKLKNHRKTKRNFKKK